MPHSLLYIFNPDHDLALANFDPNFMPTTNVRRMAADLALLPAWYATEHDFVVAPSAFNRSFLEKQKQHLHALPRLVTEVELKEHTLPFSPWGWNPAIVKHLATLAGHGTHLPNEDTLQTIRQYTHRLKAVELLKKLTHAHGNRCGESHYLTTIEALRTFVQNHETCVLKAPLSGSGKGLNWCKGTFTPHIEGWCHNTLKQQGGVVAEPAYNKVIDFAMLFCIEPSKEVRFAGYSLFETGASGAYTANKMMSDAQILNTLTAYVDAAELEHIKAQIISELCQDHAKVYTGILGVDMMICATNDTYKIHPCVEINLRMSMGMVARIIYNNHVHTQATGTYRVEYFATPAQLKEETTRLANLYPARYAEGRMRSGYFALTPVTPASNYHVMLLLE